MQTGWPLIPTVKQNNLEAYGVFLLHTYFNLYPGFGPHATFLHAKFFLHYSSNETTWDKTPRYPIIYLGLPEKRGSLDHESYDGLV